MGCILIFLTSCLPFVFIALTPSSSADFAAKHRKRKLQTLSGADFFITKKERWSGPIHSPPFHYPLCRDPLDHHSLFAVGGGSQRIHCDHQNVVSNTSSIIHFIQRPVLHAAYIRYHLTPTLSSDSRLWTPRLGQSINSPLILSLILLFMNQRPFCDLLYFNYRSNCKWFRLKNTQLFERDDCNTAALDDGFVQLCSGFC